MRYDLHHGDCLDVLRTMDAGSVDAVVTDPPYGLSFMSKEWDRGVPPVAVWAECYRLLPDGGRLLAFGGTRTAHRMWCAIEDAGFVIEDTVAWLYGSGFPKHGSKLKPGYEPVCVARKGGVSLLNIEGCRIGTDNTRRDTGSAGFWGIGGRMEGGSDSGRWPANVAHDGSDEVLEAFARFGDSWSSASNRGELHGRIYGNGKGPSGPDSLRGHNDSGTAARFYYCAKSSRAEREAGLEGMTASHPTVKPVALMRWLTRLVTPPGGTVLDPFAGSGTTGVACAAEGFSFVGIEREAEYVEIARRRIAHARRQPSLFDAA